MENKRILLVEDNPDDEILTLDALEANNIANPVDVMRDGASALDYLFCQGEYSERDIPEMPAVVLLDLKLPKIDGLEVLNRIRSNERTRYLPVVILTSSNQDEDKLNCYTGGANSYVRKPVDFDDFIKAAGQIGLYWLMLNEHPPGQE